MNDGGQQKLRSIRTHCVIRDSVIGDWASPATAFVRAGMVAILIVRPVATYITLGRGRCAGMLLDEQVAHATKEFFGRKGYPGFFPLNQQDSLPELCSFKILGLCQGLLFLFGSLKYF